MKLPRPAPSRLTAITPLEEQAQGALWGKPVILLSGLLQVLRVGRPTSASALTATTPLDGSPATPT